MCGTVPTLLKATKALKIYEFFGKNWGANNFKLRLLLPDSLTNQIKLQDVPYSDYIDEQYARAANKRVHNSASVKQMAHFAEIRGTKEFKKFDYGKEENLLVYGQESPPFIDLT